VLPHWGSEFRFRPDDGLRKLAAELAMLGGDVVAGTHPHVVQPLEKAGATLVAYSLGDFLGSVLARSPWRLRLSMALTVDFIPGLRHGSRIVGYEVHPFFRVPFRGGERIKSIATLPPRERERVERFVGRVFRGDPPRALAVPIVAAPEQVS
jgi:poly-gamma-glutamate capsule biosynthesis protein CapA/YwtB (metallophosphatase superfamily)